MIEKETTLFLHFLESNGRKVTPDLARLFVEALHRSLDERRARAEMLANMKLLPEGTVDALFDDYHLFLASQDPGLQKKAESRRKL